MKVCVSGMGSKTLPCRLDRGYLPLQVLSEDTPVFLIIYKLSAPKRSIHAMEAQKAAEKHDKHCCTCSSLSVSLAGVEFVRLFSARNSAAIDTFHFLSCPLGFWSFAVSALLT